MSYERLWERLLERLAGVGGAVELEPGRIEVRVDQSGGPRTIEIRMTRGDWDNMAGVAWGSFDDAAREVEHAIKTLPEEQSFLVYDLYELHPSATPELPPDPELERFEERRRQNPDAVGRWIAYPDERREP